MITSYRNFGVALLVLLVVSCADDRQPSAAKDHGDHQSENVNNNAGAAAAAVQLQDDRLNAVYQHYKHLTTALVREDAAEARVAANAIEAGAKQVEGGNELAATAAKISATGDIETQRTSYSNLSNEMIALVKKSGLSSGELYVDYCPMALNDEGAVWLSSEKEISNPYFGDKMLKCGEVKETLKR